jgi:hypothetical protein
MTFNFTWGQLATLISSIFVVQGAFAYHLERRLQDFRLYIDARFKAVEDRLEKIERRPV